MDFKTIFLFSSLAQEESRSISLNTAWGKRKQFADGKFAIGYKTFLGYDKGKDGKLVVNKEEAKAIKLIYKLFLMGYSLYAIKKELERKKIKTPMGKSSWHLSTIKSELTNEKYKGDALLQKNYTLDFLTKKQKKNDGELPKYYVTDDHEAIIDKATFDYVQIELKKRIKANSEVHGNRITSRYSGVSIFSGKIVCGECGSYFGKKVWHSNDKYKKFVYRCNHKYGDKKCDSGYITEDDVKNMFIIELNNLNKSEMIKNAFTIKDTLCDTSKLKTELEKANKELETLVHKNEMLILENSTKVIDQEEHKRKREEIGAAYKETNAKCEKITSEIKDKENRALVIDGFIKNLKSVKAGTDFDEELFCALVEKVVVYKDRAEIVWKGQE